MGEIPWNTLLRREGRFDGNFDGDGRGDLRSVTLTSFFFFFPSRGIDAASTRNAVTPWVHAYAIARNCSEIDTSKSIGDIQERIPISGNNKFPRGTKNSLRPSLIVKGSARRVGERLGSDTDRRWESVRTCKRQRRRDRRIDRFAMERYIKPIAETKREGRWRRRKRRWDKGWSLCASFFFFLLDEGRRPISGERRIDRLRFVAATRASTDQN